MTTYPTRTIVLILLLIAAIIGSTPVGATVTAPPAPIFASEADEDSYAWAQEMFTDNGFEFPSVTVEFHDDVEGCGGMRGRTHLPAEGDIAVIHVCATHERATVEDAWRRRTLLHELAHAWVDQNVDEGGTEALMQLRGVETWLERDAQWQDRGAEHAAEILMWGLQAGEYRLDFRISDAECDELSAAYELLTGDVVACDPAV